MSFGIVFIRFSRMFAALDVVDSFASLRCRMAFATAVYMSRGSCFLFIFTEPSRSPRMKRER